MSMHDWCARSDGTQAARECTSADFVLGFAHLCETKSCRVSTFCFRHLKQATETGGGFIVLMERWVGRFGVGGAERFEVST